MNKKIISICAALTLSLAAVAEIVQYPVAKGAEKIPYPAKLVGIVANSSVASGTVSLKEVVEVASVSDSYEVVTNVVEAGADYRVADAYVGQMRVWTGSDALDWIRWSNTITNSFTTNIVSGVTNVTPNTTTYNLAKWCDGAVTNAVVWTNEACSVKYRDIIATAPVTNIVRRNFQVWSHTPMTNDLYSGTLSSGALSAAITNKFLIGGATLLGGGSIYTTSGAKSSAYLILER